MDAANADLSRTKARLSASDIELQVFVFPGLVQASVCVCVCVCVQASREHGSRFTVENCFESVSVVKVVRICELLRASNGGQFSGLGSRLNASTLAARMPCLSWNCASAAFT